MAVVWRSTCGVTFFLSNEGQGLEAVTICLARMYRTPSPLRRPRTVQKLNLVENTLGLDNDAARAQTW